MKRRNASTARWIPFAAAALVLLGLADFHARTVRSLERSSPALLKGPFWEARDGGGRLVWRRGGGSPRLEPGESLLLFRGKDEGFLLRSFSFTGIRADWRAGFRLTYTQGPKSAVLLRLAPAEHGGAVLAVQGPRGAIRTVDRDANREILPPPRRPCTIKLENGRKGFSVRVEGRTVFRVPVVLRSAGSITLTPEGGAWILQRLAADGARTGEAEPLTACRYVERFQHLYRKPAEGKRARFRLHLVLLLAGLAAYLRACCPGGAPLTALVRGAAYALLPAAACVEGWKLLGLPALLPLAAAALAAGLAWARRGLGNAGRVLLPAARAGGTAAFLAAAATLALAAWDAGALAVQRYGPAIAAEQAAIRRTPPVQPFRLDAPRRLGPEETLPAKGFFRNADVKLRVFLDPGSALEIQLRQPRPDRGRRLYFLLSTDPGRPSGFHLDTAGAVERLGGDVGAVQAEGLHTVGLSMRGRDFAARVDRGPTIRARCRYLPAGLVVLHAKDGPVRVSRFEVVPRKHRERYVTTFPDFILWAAGPVVFVFFGACLFAVLGTAPFLRAAEALAFAVFPVACGLFGLEFGEPGNTAGSPAALLCAAVLYLAFLGSRRAHLNPLSRLVFLALLFLGAAWAGAGLGLWAGPSWM